jgi:hypothetical protein
VSEPQPALKDIKDDEELKAELDRVFDYHAPTGHIVNVHNAWRALVKQFAIGIMGLPATRERAMAVTRLEECAFWIHATIARNHDKIPHPDKSEDPLKVDDKAVDEIIDVADGKHDDPLEVDDAGDEEIPF